MKKFEQLGKKLSIADQKNILGGYYNQDSAKYCNTDADCGTSQWDCPSGTITTYGRCYSHQCRYIGICN